MAAVAFAAGVLKAALAAFDVVVGKALHAHFIRRNNAGIVLHNFLVNLYCKCGLLDDAHRLFTEMPLRNHVSLNVLMAGYLHSGCTGKALELFRNADLGVNEFVLTTAMAAAVDSVAYNVGLQLHGAAAKHGLMSHLHVRNAVVDMYCKCGSMVDAVRIFEAEVSGFDAFVFNSMVAGFLDDGSVGDATTVVLSMINEVERWDIVSYISVLRLCGSASHLCFGKQVHCQALKHGVEASIYISGAIIDMYGKCGTVSNARRAFELLPEKNVVSWTSLIAACMQNELFEDALHLFVDAKSLQIAVNCVTYAVALNCCANLSSYRTGSALNAQAEKSGYKDRLNVNNALINMYAKSGSIQDAVRVFIEMPSRNAVSWNSMITGYAQHGLSREALQAFQDMLGTAEIPTYVTFVGVLAACAHLGLEDEGRRCLNHMMRNLGIAPGKEHYTCVVSLLCRPGHLDEAEDLLRTTPCIQHDVVAWRTLLSACQVYKNYDLGYQVADHILQLNPRDVRTYVLLSNIYARTNMWEGVFWVREKMREVGVKKEPGISWIYVGTELYVFTSGDCSHPYWSSISRKLSELIDQIKLLGYVPSTSLALHDVEEEQKEEHLKYHSEKLTVAFALVSCPEGETIRIMKNLRICEDCHVAMKLISVATGRKIIIRDASRFHCIQDGVCSCDDFW